MDVERPVIPFLDTGQFAQIYHMAQAVCRSNETSSPVMLLVLPSYINLTEGEHFQWDFPQL
jgi:hypothetical protein